MKLETIKFNIKKHSPEILTVTGVTGIVSGVILSCRATLKVTDVIEQHKVTLEQIAEAKKIAIEDKSIEYSEKDAKKDKAILTVQTGAKFAKLYLIPALCIGGGIACLLKSNSILRKRGLALGAAYLAVDKAFKDYRSRVVERFGEDVDYQLYYNIKTEEIEETVVDDKGKEKKVKKKVDIVDPNALSGYSRIFDKSNPNWEKSMDANKMWLEMQMHYADDLLKARGFLTLNEVYELLGFKTTKAGMVVGWKYDKKNPSGDNFVEFDIREVSVENQYNGYYDQVLAIDFNVDGNIYETM